MERYCSNCKKSFDFEISKMSELDSLTCPECGAKIAKDARPPQVDDAEEKVTSILGRILHFIYIFYFLCAAVGVTAYFLHLPKVLYTFTALALFFFIFQFFTGYVQLKIGILFIPLAAFLGYLKFHNLEGICLFILLAFAALHIVRDVIWRLILAVVKFFSKF